MKSTRIFIAFFVACFFILLLLFSCKSSKPLAMQADTIRLTEKVIHYQTEYVIKDSVIRDTVPCDPLNPITIQKTIYQTKLKTIIDTIYTDKEKSIINPINSNLQAENAKLLQKARVKNFTLLFLIGFIVIGIAIRRLIK